MSLRTFTVLDYPREGNEWGQFVGQTPLECAHHAFRALADDMGFIDSKDGQEYIVFTIKDLKPNKNNNKNGRNYIGTWVNLHKPIPVEESGEFVRRRPVVTNWVAGLEETFKVK